MSRKRGRISPACFLSEFFILMPVLFCLSEKFFRCSDKTSGIFHPGCLIRRMHRKLRKSDIYRIHRYLRIRNISQGRSARHIGAIHKGLVFYACPPYNSDLSAVCLSQKKHRRKGLCLALRTYALLLSPAQNFPSFDTLLPVDGSELSFRLLR